MQSSLRTIALCVMSLLFATIRATQSPGDYFKITVMDEETGRGVPLVELKTTSGARFYTNSNGIVAFDEPGMMNQEVYFHLNTRLWVKLTHIAKRPSDPRASLGAPECNTQRARPA